MGKFKIKETASGGFKFDLYAANGQIVAASQMYKKIPNCRIGIESVMNNAPAAAVENQTVMDYEAQKHPKFEVYQDKAGEYRFRLRAKNGKTIVVSEGYKKIDSCMNGIASVKKNSVDAETEIVK